MAKVSVEPFLRWVAADAEQRGDIGGFHLFEAPIVSADLMVETPKEAAPAERCTDKRTTPMNLPDVVQAAVKSKIQAELRPLSDRVSRLRATLDAYEVHATADAERRVSNAMLVALGGAEVAANPAFETARDELRAALDAVEELVAPQPEPEPVSAPAPPPEAAEEPEPIHAPPVPAPTPVRPPPVPVPPRKLKPEDVAQAKRLIVEVETLKAEFREQHPARLFPLIQAATAEIRLLLERLPEEHEVSSRLGSLIPLLHAIKNEGGVEDFVRGLAFGQKGDWNRLSYANRKRVADYDRDVAASERRQGPPDSKGKKKTEPEPTNGHSHQWPDLPQLNKLTKPILLAGGMIIPEKLKNVRERFGLTVEWHEIDHDNPRASDTLMQRIRAGKVGAIVILEGVMRHSTFKPMIDACNTHDVPYAMGDKAGVASLQSAFSELERKLSL